MTKTLKATFHQKYDDFEDVCGIFLVRETQNIRNIACCGKSHVAAKCSLRLKSGVLHVGERFSNRGGVGTYFFIYCMEIAFVEYVFSENSERTTNHELEFVENIC